MSRRPVRHVLFQPEPLSTVAEATSAPVSSAIVIRRSRPGVSRAQRRVASQLRDG
jgi:hypothetical protein